MFVRGFLFLQKTRNAQKEKGWKINAILRNVQWVALRAEFVQIVNLEGWAWSQLLSKVGI